MYDNTSRIKDLKKVQKYSFSESPFIFKCSLAALGGNDSSFFIFFIDSN